MKCPVPLHADGGHTRPCRWITLILCAGIEWLKSIYEPHELAEPEKLLKKLEKNTPAWCFVGFLYYHASMVWGTRKAIQVSREQPDALLWLYTDR